MPENSQLTSGKKRKRATGDEQMTHDDGAKTKRSKNSKSKSSTNASAPKVEPKPSNETSSEAPKALKFIVFVGNLPYTATTEAVEKHFRKLEPISVRHVTKKETGKSKGFAFLEFDRFDHMKTCLKLYHHTMFEDGTSPARKINVELTAGGGGSKSTVRKEKIKEKNAKLTEERKRRMLEEQKQKLAKEKKEAAAKEGDRPDSNGPGGIHPSRLSQVQQ